MRAQQQNFREEAEDNITTQSQINLMTAASLLMAFNSKLQSIRNPSPDYLEYMFLAMATYHCFSLCKTTNNVLKVDNMYLSQIADAVSSSTNLFINIALTAQSHFHSNSPDTLRYITNGMILATTLALIYYGKKESLINSEEKALQELAEKNNVANEINIDENQDQDQLQLHNEAVIENNFFQKLVLNYTKCFDCFR